MYIYVEVIIVLHVVMSFHNLRKYNLVGDINDYDIIIHVYIYLFE